MSLVRVQVRRSALVHNLKLIKHYAQSSHIWGVVKANAYGHGVDLVVPVIMSEVDGLACARIEEAVRLRSLTEQEGQPEFPVLILGGCYTVETLLLAQVKRFHVVIHTLEQLEELTRAVKSEVFALDGVTLKVWVKLNVGMNRLGFPILQVKSIVNELLALSSVQVYGVMAHLGTADQPNNPETLHQMRACVDAFAQVKQQVPGLVTSLSNSAHLFAARFQDDYNYPWHGQRGDWVRPGISLYGASPFDQINAPELGLRPVMQLEAKIVAVRDLLPGETAGYGATWTATVPVRLFVVACGYGDGYPRHIENASASWNGLELLQAGRVSMDFTLFYCSIELLQDLPAPPVGDFVELWGDDVLVDDVARKSRTIGYERLTQIGHRIAYSLVDD